MAKALMRYMSPHSQELRYNADIGNPEDGLVIGRDSD
jgi:hypothetical protein